MPLLNKIPFSKKDEKVPIFENDDVELFWEYLNLENFQEWKTDYEPIKTEYLTNKFIELVNSRFLLNIKLFQWDIRIIKELLSFYKNGYFYFLKIRLKKNQKVFYLGFITFLENFYPYKCKSVKCNNLLITSHTKFPFLWYIYAHSNFKQLMQEFFKKEIDYIDLCDYLIFTITKSNAYWLKSDNEILLDKVYKYEKNFFPFRV